MKTRLRPGRVSIGWIPLAVAVVAALVMETAQPVAAATQIDIAGPPGSGAFGTSVAVLSNGNILVTDPDYDAGAIADVGAVYLYDGATGALISALTGSTAGDQVGCDPSGWVGVTILSNGNYVVPSPNWDNGAATDAGAVTWGNGTTGVGGVVSAANSLVGSTTEDYVGGSGVVPLNNGNYVVISSGWNNGPATDVGAVTWGNGTTGVKGMVSGANSLVGSTAGDKVGYHWVTSLSNGNYVVCSLQWDSGVATDVGAVTWGNGMSGIVGVVSAANSLVGSHDDDQIGSDRLTVLSNGNYVISSPSWDHVISPENEIVDAGAVTWGSGATGAKGVVSAANSLVGSTAGDRVGDYYIAVTALSNGNYVVTSPYWDNGAAVDAGAATWGSGTTGTAGAVSAANSLVGSTAGDEVGYHRVTALSNGNYVVCSPHWDNGAARDAGAVTWGHGTTGIAGPVSVVNSLVGSHDDDQLCGYGVTPLSSGNYVVTSPYWDNGAAVDAGAATWGNGTTGTAGVVSAANSLVGSTAGDQVACAGDSCYLAVTALSNGNYVVRSSGWDNGTATDAGAVTWGSGTTGVAGPVSVANSLVGTTAGDHVACADSLCMAGMTALSNGNYVVSSPDWDNGAVANGGAATWGNGTSGTVGPVSAANSLVGDKAYDSVGLGRVTALSNGNYVVRSSGWDNGAATDAGAVTWGSGATGITGPVSVANSLVGTTAGDHVACVGALCWGGVTALSNGNYVVTSPDWDNGTVASAGAVTWRSGTTLASGAVSAANSLVGSTAGDHLGCSGYFCGTVSAVGLSKGNYVVCSPSWDSGTATNAGAVTWGNGFGGTAGAITVENGVRGTAENGGDSMCWAYDGVNHQLVVGRPEDNIVTLFILPPVYPAFLPASLRSTP